MAVLTPNTLWPPLVQVTIAWLSAQMPDVPVVYDTGEVAVDGVALSLDQAVQQTPGVIQVIRTPGGGASSDTDEHANIDLYFYGASIDAVESLAQRGHSFMLQMQSAAGWYVDEVRGYSSPGDVPYSNPLVVRWVGSYGVTSSPQQ